MLLLHGFPQFWWAWRRAARRARRRRLPRGRARPARLRRVRQAAARLRRLHAVVGRRRHGARARRPRRGRRRARLGRRARVDRRDAAPRRSCRAWPCVSMPHPLRLREARAAPTAEQLRALSPVALLPAAAARPRRGCAGDDGAYVGELLRRWGGPGFPDAETEARCRAAVQVPGVAHCSMEWYRWAVRSRTRPSGWRFLRLLERGVGVPTLQVHGAARPAACSPAPRTAPARGSTRRTSCRCSTASATSRTRRRRTTSAPRCSRTPSGGRAVRPRPRARRRRPAGAARLAGGRGAGAGGGAAAGRGARAGPRPAGARPAVLRPRRARGAPGRPRPAQERLLWQGLAQVCVGLTHLQRGNPVGGARLLRRGADRLEEHLRTGSRRRTAWTWRGRSPPRGSAPTPSRPARDGPAVAL